MGPSKVIPRSLALLAFALTLLSACSVELPIPPGAWLTCQQTSECPSGQVCNAGACVAADSLGEPPDLEGAAGVEPAVGRAGTSFSVRFAATRPLGKPPKVTLNFDVPVDLSCDEEPAQHYRCSYLATGNENNGAGGIAWLDVELVDLGRTRVVKHNVATLRLDFAPPGLAGAPTVSYVPGPGSPLSSVQAAANGTRLVISALSNEALDEAQPPTMTISLDGGTPLSVPLTAHGTGGATFELVLSGSPADGVYAPQIRWTDLAGNVADAVTFATPQIRVKTSTPVLAVAQDQVTFLRSPWGSAAAESLGAFTLDAGPYFGLAPADPLAGAATLPAGTFSHGTSALLFVRVWADAQKAGLLGTFAPNADGSWPRYRAPNLDVPTVYLSGVDEAGNESAPTKIQNAEWVATPNPPPVGQSPHALLAIVAAPSTRVAYGDTVTPAAGVTGAAGDGLTVSSEPSWRQLVGSPLPPKRTRGAAAFDVGRGRTVLFGGDGGPYLRLGDTWEWDGFGWSNHTASGAGPEPRAGHAMAYNGARGRVMMFGGQGSATGLNDLWEWDGARWRALPPGLSPPARTNAALAFDSARGKLVLFGGTDPGGVFLDDLWEWDDAGWARRQVAGPPARAGHAMAYDAGRARTVLFGGLRSGATGASPEVWEWDGTSWTNPPAPAGPGGRVNHAMAYLASSGRVVTFAGKDAYGTYRGDLCEWNGSAWSCKSAVVPVDRDGSAMAYDAVRDRLVIFAGQRLPVPGLLGDTYEWNGASFHARFPQSTSPSPRTSAPMVYGSRGRTLLFGGSNSSTSLQDTWEHDGYNWTSKLSTTQPSARSQHAMAYDPLRMRVVLFGGWGPVSALGDTWEWTGNDWVQKSPVNSPPARIGAAMVFDPVSQRVLLFGGRTGWTPTFQDVWEWDGINWQERTTPSPPPARVFHGMVWDPVQGGLFVFGGQIGPALTDIVIDMWSLAGPTWTRLYSTASSPPRAGHTMVFDPDQGVPVTFGGADGVQTRNRVHLWSGSDWLDKSPSAGRAAPSERERHGAVYDPARKRIITFGGAKGAGPLNDETWELDMNPARRPAVHFEVDASAAGIPASSVTGLRVRSRAGGTHATGSGASLVGWSLAGPGGPEGWSSLDSTAAGPTSPSAIDWKSPAAPEARRYFSPLGLLTVQVRPSGGAGVGGQEASVQVDTLEVRVRYAP